MAIIATFVNIHQPVEIVFAFLSDPDHHRKINPNITGMESSGKAAPGMEEMVMTQIKNGMDTSLAAIKMALEG